jgi:MerR family transcriptional regulator, light-induced transcriptional regulator
MNAQGLLRIGELSRRSGVSPELLRAWERRYGLLRPSRSPGGLRLYSQSDLERVRLMQEQLAAGVAAAEAAAAASRHRIEGGGPAAFSAASARAELGEALERFDEPAAQAAMDRILAAATIDTVLGEVVLPYMHELGERWESDRVSIAQEHFASGVLRGRLLGLARGWGFGLGPLALLACLPGEEHDLGLIAFGLALRARGWRIAFLGPNTPVATVADASDRLRPDLVVLSAVAPDRVDAVAVELRELAVGRRVALAGGAAERAPAGLVALAGAPVAEAERVGARAESAAPSPPGPA